MKLLSFIMFALILSVNHVLAETKKNIDPNLENLSGLYAECAAYYTIVYHAVANAGDKETASSYGQLQEQSINASLLLASQGRDLQTAKDVTMSRIEMYTQQMKKETNGRNENISILTLISKRL